MRIEEGKYYRAANGEKVGPMTPWLDGSEHPWQWKKSNGSPDEDRLYREDGSSDYNPHLISEWADEGPIRTVTRQEIIPGTYDGVVVGNVGASGVQVSVRIDDGWYDAATLERAAAVLTALAGALRDGE